MRRIIGAFLTASLIFLAGHDVVQARHEPHAGPCQICVMAACAVPHTPKAKPAPISISLWTNLPEAPRTMSADLRLARAASRAPPAV